MVLGETHGLFGRIFSDFGESFTILDTDGEKVDDNAVSEVHLTFESEKPILQIGVNAVMPYQRGVVQISSSSFKVTKNVNLATVEDADKSRTLSELLNEHQY